MSHQRRPCLPVRATCASTFPTIAAPYRNAPTGALRPARKVDEARTINSKTGKRKGLLARSRSAMGAGEPPERGEHVGQDPFALIGGWSLFPCGLQHGAPE